MSEELTRRSAKRLRAPVIVDRLLARYGDDPVELDHASAFQLLVATILSAQSTDRKVNEVTRDLFRDSTPGLPSWSPRTRRRCRPPSAPRGSSGRRRSRLQGMSAELLERHDGEVPLSMAELVALPGVARKTANVVLGEWAPQRHAGDPDAGIAVDTHVKRLARRFGFTRQTEPERIESDLMKLLPKDRWPKASLVTILHGRRVCDAQRPRCGDCLVEDLCPSSQLAGRRDLAGQAKGLGA